MSKQLLFLFRTYSIATNEKQVTRVLLSIFMYSAELHKAFLEGFSRLGSLDMDESGTG